MQVRYDCSLQQNDVGGKVADVVAALELKYHRDISSLAGCPPAPARELRELGYRFATAKLTDACNLLPPYKTSPNRWVGERRTICCSAFALSMYVTREALLHRARVGLSNSPLFLKRLGDHYVELSLRPESGRQTPPSGAGHFDLHEYRTFDFMAAVRKHEKLPL